MTKIMMRKFILTDVKHLLKKDIIIIANLPEIKHPTEKQSFTLNILRMEP